MLPDLSKYARIAIVGRPRVGKTTLGMELSRKYKRSLTPTDDYLSLPFDEVPNFIIRDHKNAPEYIIEGVQAARAIKKGLEVDLVIWLQSENAVETKHKGLASMVMNSMAEYSGPLLQVLRIGKVYSVRGERR